MTTRWRATVAGGRVVVLETFTIARFSSELEARDAATARGATLAREKIQGSIYVNAETGSTFRVERDPILGGFILSGVREARS